jgi:hypothetical protein
MSGSQWNMATAGVQVFRVDVFLHLGWFYLRVYF